MITRPLKNDHFHGLNGMGDIDFWKPEYPTDENELVRPESAVQIIRDLVMQYPNEISLIGLGPLTNFALAVKMYPEIKDKIKDIHLMGGNYRGIQRFKLKMISKLRNNNNFYSFDDRTRKYNIVC